MPTIKIPQLQKEIQVKQGVFLMRALLDAGVPVASSCHGDGVCGKCKMTVLGSPDSFSPPNETEKILTEKLSLKSDYRFSCQVVVRGDVEVRTTYW